MVYKPKSLSQEPKGGRTQEDYEWQKRTEETARINNSHAHTGALYNYQKEEEERRSAYTTYSHTLDAYDYKIRSEWNSTTTHYIFYLPQWKNQAKDDKESIADYYRSDGKNIKLIEISSTAQFVSDWNAMGTETGKDSRIGTVIVNVHGDHLGIGGENCGMTSADISTLDVKSVDELFLFGCNTGHLDYKETNPAASFSRIVDGAPVLAGDGTVRAYRENLLFGTFVYQPRNNKSFRQKLNKNFPERDNDGWVVYSYENGQINTRYTNKEKLSVAEMMNIA